MTDISVFILRSSFVHGRESAVTMARGQICSEVLSLFLLYISNMAAHKPSSSSSYIPLATILIFDGP